MSAELAYWAWMPDRFLSESPALRLRLYREAVACGQYETLRDAVNATSRRYARWHRDQVAALPGELRERAWRKDRKRWRLARALVPAGPCVYCGEPNARTVDHVIPRSRGGTHALSNLVRACIRCNSRKGNRLLAPSAAGGGGRRAAA